MLEALGHDEDDLCLACLNGNYPIPISTQTKLGLDKFMLEAGGAEVAPEEADIASADDAPDVGEF